jgi:uncharacterized protein YdiU (UPF0061 family)
MLKHPTLDQLREMKLDGMANAFVELAEQDNARDLGHAEWLALLIDRETADRGTKRFQTRLGGGDQGENSATIRMRTSPVVAGRREGVARP